MKKLIKDLLASPKGKAFKSYARAVLASAITYALANLANFDPMAAIAVGSIAGPLAKWADKAEKDFGRKKKPALRAK